MENVGSSGETNEEEQGFLQSPTGFTRRLIHSTEIWHLNSLAALFVALFICWQFRSMFSVGKHNPNRLDYSSANTNSSSFSSSPRHSLQVSGGDRRGSRRELVDKLVGDSLDVVDDHDDLPSHQSGKEVPYRSTSISESEMQKRSQLFYELMKVRRSVRRFDPHKPVPVKLIQNLVKTAGSAPSGANLQPWSFCVVGSQPIKTRIREIVEAEEQLNYARRMGAKWVLDLDHLNVNWNKPYLTEAPFLIVVLKQAYQVLADGTRQPTYYNEMSVSIAVGILLAAIQNAGLVTVTTTPLNAGGQIRELLQRPVNEKVTLLLPVGHPAEGAHVPNIKRKAIEEILRIY